MKALPIIGFVLLVTGVGLWFFGPDSAQLIGIGLGAVGAIDLVVGSVLVRRQQSGTQRAQ